MLKLRVRSVTYEAEGILSFELVDPAGGLLPPFDAGAHLDVRIPGGLSRRYSLCGAPGTRDHYKIAVLKAPNSRGGSLAMHERVRAGDLIEVSAPHNFFPLVPQARRSLLLAGGIGITPMLAMLHQLRADGADYEMHYCTTSPERTAFAAELADEVARGRVHLHHDGGDPRRGLDLMALLRERAEGEHVYFCGPGGFMKAIQAAAAHWPKEAVHFEYFGAEPVAAPVAPAADAQAMELVLSRSGRTVPIEASQTILAALRAAGVPCESSCESGVCGACKQGYSAGKPAHTDYLLSDEEHESQVLVCCATVAEGPLVLDL